MLKVRIAAAATALLVAIGSAAAQSIIPTAPTDTVQPGRWTNPDPAKTAKKPPMRRHRLVARPHHSAKTARTAAPEKATPAADAGAAKPAKMATSDSPWPAGEVVAAPAHSQSSDDIWPAATPAGVTANVTADPSAPDAAAPASQFAIDGGTVQVTAPDNLKQTDRAAGDREDLLKAKFDEASGAKAMMMSPTHRHAAAVGSASWIAQVLAALGGAVTAAAVAWFLISPAPPRLES